MSIFEAVDVRKRIEHEHDFVAKLSQQYIRDTPQGIQCAACGMFVVGPEPRRAPRAGLVFFSDPKPGESRYVMDHLAFQHTGDVAKILGVQLSA